MIRYSDDDSSEKRRKRRKKSSSFNSEKTKEENNLNEDLKKDLEGEMKRKRRYDSRRN